MDIKKERLEEIVKEELEAFYEGEVPMEEGAGDKIKEIVSFFTKGRTVTDPEEKERIRKQQKSMEAQVGLATDIRKRPVDFSKMSKKQKKEYVRNLVKLKSKQPEA